MRKNEGILKKKLVSAAALLTAAVVSVTALASRPKEETFPSAAPPAVVETAVPEEKTSAQTDTEKKKGRRSRLRESFLGMPVWARKLLMAPLYVFGAVLSHIMRKFLPPLLGRLFLAILPALLLLLALKLIFPDMPLKALFSRRNTLAALALAVLLGLAEIVMPLILPDKEGAVAVVKTAMLAVCFAAVCVQIKNRERKRNALVY